QSGRWAKQTKRLSTTMYQGEIACNVWPGQNSIATCPETKVAIGCGFQSKTAGSVPPENVYMNGPNSCLVYTGGMNSNKCFSAVITCAD
ncbi:hypothetical protein, partial [Chromobacterium subtsugae]